MCTNCCLPAFDQHYDAAVGFRNHNFLYGTDIFAIDGPLLEFFGHILLRMRMNCYFRASGQNFDITVRVSDPDFLNHGNYSAIKRLFQHDR